MKNNFLGKNIAGGLIALLVLLGVSFILGVYFETHIQQFADYFVREYHPFALFGFIYFNDLIISPVPPDVFLLILAKASSFPNRDLVVLGMGLASTLAGISAWFLSKNIVKEAWLGKKFQAYMKENEIQLKKFGKWMVALGALTPIPYSMTCWAAGVIKMDAKSVALMSSLRVIRFYGYYYILLWAERLMLD